VTLDELRERCDVEGAHWIWGGYTIRGRPQCSIGGVNVQGPRITATVLGTSRQRRSGQCWYAACGERLCLSPKCLRLGPYRDAHQTASKAGRLKRNPAQIAKVIAARRAQPDVLPEWMVEWALESPQSNGAVGHALGVSKTTVYQWRNGLARAAHRTGMFSQLMMGA
jgi:hypothetical protein